MANSSLRRPSAEENLAVEQYPHLNERFYASGPPGYFQARLNLLMLSASRAADLDALLVEGVQFGGLRAHIDVSAATECDEQAHRAFVSAEAEVLLHHASEALLRLFFAHADNAPCPWLECAKLTSFAQFKEQVAQLRDSSTPEEQVARVFLGGTPAAPDEQWTQSVATVGRFLRLVAGRVLGDAHLYNAAKHGFAVLAGPVGLSVTNDACGRNSHRIPVYSTNRIPHMTFRWSSRIRPGYRKRRSTTGSSGSIRSHNPSSISHGLRLTAPVVAPHPQLAAIQMKRNLTHGHSTLSIR